jgi:hypothetical protein
MLTRTDGAIGAGVGWTLVAGAGVPAMTVVGPSTIWTVCG